MPYPWAPGGTTTTPTPGTSGVAGSSFRSGFGVPNSALGSNGDTYADKTPGVGTTYTKVGGAWVADGGSVLGPSAIGLQSGAIDGMGHLILTLTNGAQIDAGSARGANGTNGTSGTNGSNGATGSAGANGTDGVGVQSGTVDGTGHLILTLTNGVVQDLGLVKGADGVGGGGSLYKSDGSAPTSVSVASPTTATSISTAAPAVTIYVSGGDVYVTFNSTTPTTASTRWRAGETYEVTTNADVTALRFILASGTPVLSVQSEVLA